MIVVFERHLQVEPHKLCEVPVCVRIFCPEDPTNSEYLKHKIKLLPDLNCNLYFLCHNLIKVSGNGHLLVKLW